MGFIFLMFVASAQAQEELNEGGGIFSDENGQLSLSSLFQNTTTDKSMKKELKKKLQKELQKEPKKELTCTLQQFQEWRDSKAKNNERYQEFLLWVAFEGEK
jgi:hypothetical protein